MGIGIERRLQRKLLSYLHLNDSFYEKLSNYESKAPAFEEAIESLVGDEWTISDHGTWLYADHPEGDIPRQGFKIHVSAVPENAEEILRVVTSTCVKEGVPFKFRPDLHILGIINSKNFSRGSAGKFITAYPSDVAQFEELAEVLHQRTREFEGPYILSDKRYKEDGVVFYRYGGIRPDSELNLYGEQIPVITSPDGTKVPDQRLPFFKLPSWVENPLEGMKDTEEKEDTILKDRYKIQGAYSFSNAGGVYEAEDTNTGELVLIKEARPSVGLKQNHDVDAVQTLKKEHDMLCRLEEIPHIPDPLDYFEEWEHAFLVEEHVNGMKLSSYRAREDLALLLQHEYTESAITDFCRSLNTIAGNLMKAVEACHEKGVIVRDLSPTNILIDLDSLDVKIIDLESACLANHSTGGDGFYFTSGFAPPERGAKSSSGFGVSFEDDYYSLGSVLYSVVYPIQAYFRLNPGSADRFIDSVIEETGLPPYVKEMIWALTDERNLDKALGVLEENRDVENINIDTSSTENSEATPNAVENTIDGINRYIRTSYDLEREDRLWPTDYRVFSTNPLSVAYGAMGTAMYLKEATGEVPEEVENWILNRETNLTTTPPGLYVGLSGIAWGLSKLGRTAEAEETMRLACESPLVHEGCDIFYGDAGLGLACLRLWNETGNPYYLTKAQEAGNFVLENATPERGGYSWENVDGMTYSGFAHGASGIALFLLYLYLATDDGRFADAAIKGMEYEISGAVKVQSNDSITWNRAQGNKVRSPYWRYGSAGVGSALIRFHDITGEDKYLHLAEKAARYADANYSVHPGQFTGMSGMGEFFVDMFRYTGSEKHLRSAWGLTNVLLFEIEKPEGTAFPGEDLLRISNGLGAGSAGVGLFLNRLLDPSKRMLHDLKTGMLNAEQQFGTQGTTGSERVDQPKAELVTANA